MSRNINKCYRIPDKHWRQVRGRLEWIKKTKPQGVHDLQQWRSRFSKRHRVWLLRTSQTRLNAENLKTWLESPLATCASARLQIMVRLWQIIDNWTHTGFIHGDISPSNIIVLHTTAAGNPDAVFIDWVLDLQKPQGTPRYSAPPFWHGPRTHAGDRYALSLISLKLMAVPCDMPLLNARSVQPNLFE